MRVPAKVFWSQLLIRGRERVKSPHHYIWQAYCNRRQKAMSHPGILLRESLLLPHPDFWLSYQQVFP